MQKKNNIQIFYKFIKNQSAYPLHPVKTNNACPIRLTATAGTTFSRDCLLFNLSHKSY